MHYFTNSDYHTVGMCVNEIECTRRAFRLFIVLPEILQLSVIPMKNGNPEGPPLGNLVSAVLSNLDNRKTLLCNMPRLTTLVLDN